MANSNSQMDGKEREEKASRIKEISITEKKRTEVEKGVNKLKIFDSRIRILLLCVRAGDGCVCVWGVWGCVFCVLFLFLFLFFCFCFV